MECFGLVVDRAQWLRNSLQDYGHGQELKQSETDDKDARRNGHPSPAPGRGLATLFGTENAQPAPEMLIIEQREAQHNCQQIEECVIAGQRNQQLKGDGDPCAGNSKPARH